MLSRMYKTDFSVFSQEKNLVYFDSAASTLRPNQVSDKMFNYGSFQHANIHRGAYKLSYDATSMYDGVREKVAEFIHAASSDSIIFTYGTTDGINHLAHSLSEIQELGEGDEIVVSIFEHHSNLVPWQQLAKLKKCRLSYLYDFTQESLETITQKTRIVAVTLMSNATGYMPPVRDIIARAHEVGALVVCDGAQYMGHERMDVTDLDMDFLVFSGHKMFAPTGIGVLYGKKELLRTMPPYRYGGDMIEYVYEQETTFAEIPNRFEAGTPNIDGVIGLGAAIDYIESIGIASITQHVNGLRDYCYKGLKELDFVELLELDIFGREVPQEGTVTSDGKTVVEGTATSSGKTVVESTVKFYSNETLGIAENSFMGPVIAFNLKDVHPHDVASILDASNIAIRAGHHCAQPLMKHLGENATCRVSFQVYNTREDIDYFISKLSGVRRWLGYES